MPRYKKEKNMVAAGRIETILKEQGITQTEMADIISKTEGGTSVAQQTISKLIKGQTNVSYEYADIISRAFPRYSKEYILGSSNYRNKTEEFAATISSTHHEGALLELGLHAFAELSGFNIGLVEPAKPINKDESIYDVKSYIEQIKAGYFIRKENKTALLSIEEFNALENYICDFVELTLNSVLNTKGCNNGTEKSA